MGVVEKGPLCELGRCQCIPTCDAQRARVDAFLASARKIPEADPPPPELVPGHEWLCTACRTIQPRSGMHCGYRVILVESKDLERDSRGRIVRATSADLTDLYRKAPPGALANWKART